MNTQASGISFLSILTLIFIGLKLAGVGIVAEWSWWAVLSPLWVPWLLVICIGIPGVLIYAVAKAWRR